MTEMPEARIFLSNKEGNICFNPKKCSEHGDYWVPEEDHIAQLKCLLELQKQALKNAEEITMNGGTDGEAYESLFPDVQEIVDLIDKELE